MLLEVRIRGYADLDKQVLPEFDEVEGRYRHITPACVDRAINRAKRLTTGKTPMTHHQAIIMNQVREPGKCLFSVILDTQPVRRA